MKNALVVLTAFALSTAGIGTAMAAESHMGTAPGVIASAGIGSCDALQGDSSDWNTQPLADRLKADGINFSSISTFGNCFQVAALNAKNQPSIQLYDPSTLDRVM